MLLRLVLLSMLVLMAGCSTSMNDLKKEIKDILARKPGPIDPIPPVIRYPAYSIDEDKIIDPFLPPMRQVYVEPTNNNTNNGITIDTTRRRELLEQYPLDSLQFVGHLEKNNIMYALVKAPDNTIHPVIKDNYMGQDHGRIVEITELEIRLQEIVSNGFGGFDYKDNSIALTE